MPWNNQNGGGGWKGGGGNNGGPWGQGPWGQGGGGKPGGQPPDLEEILKRSQDRMKQVMPSGGPPGILMFLIFAIAAAVEGTMAPCSPISCPAAACPPIVCVLTFVMAGAPVMLNTASTLPTRSVTAITDGWPRVCASPAA